MRRLTLSVLAAVLVVVPASAQEPLPVSEDMLHEVGKWAARYPAEIILCMEEDDWTLPTHASANQQGASLAADCPLNVKVLWHTHPGQLLIRDSFKRFYFKETGTMPRRPRDACYLSETDVTGIQTTRPVKRDDLKGSPVQYETPWAIVQVDRDTYCWWSPEQIEAIEEPDGINRPPDGQTSWADG